MRGLWRGVQLLLHRYVPVSDKLAVASSMFPLVARLLCEEKYRKEAEVRLHVVRGIESLCAVTSYSTCSELRAVLEEEKGKSLCASVYSMAERVAKLTPAQQAEYMAVLLAALVAVLSRPEDYEVAVLELSREEYVKSI